MSTRSSIHWAQGSRYVPFVAPPARGDRAMIATRANEGEVRPDGTPRILIMEAKGATVRFLARIAKTFGTVSVEATVSCALEHLSVTGALGAAIVDLGLPDSSGLNVVSRVRATDATVADLIPTEQGDGSAINAAFDLRAR
jgi:ActR/RegA family two-component response regulator